MKISEIFRSIEGEGPRQGHLCTFIRTHSCPLRCSYCDSLYAVEGNDFIEMTIVDIMNEVNRLGGYFCTVTGGEPLIQQDLSLLINELTNQGYLVNIETSGAVICSISENGSFIKNLRLFDSEVDIEPVVYEGSWYTFSSIDRGGILTLQVRPNTDSSPRSLELSLMDADLNAQIFIEQAGVDKE